MLTIRILLVMALFAVEFVVIEGHRSVTAVAASAPVSAVIDR